MSQTMIKSSHDVVKSSIDKAHDAGKPASDYENRFANKITTCKKILQYLIPLQRGCENVRFCTLSSQKASAT